MDFKISYEDAKKILGIFYNAPYRQVIEFVAILDNLKQIDGELTLKQMVEAEIAATNSPIPKTE
jgi:hypothetical protein